MKQKIKLTAKYILALGSLLVPFFAKAQNQVTNGLQSSGLEGLFGRGGLNSSMSLQELIINVIRLMLLFAGGIAIVFVIIGGYYYVTSRGNEEQAEQGQKTVTNAIIGIVLIILSYVIITVIANLVSSNSGYGF